MKAPMATLLLFGVSLALLTSHKAAAEDISVNTRKEQEEYLRRFAYMGSDSPDPRFASITNPETIFEMAVKKFQKMAGLRETGNVDEETKKMMEMPRCQVKDEIGMGMVTKRRRRYAAEGSRWRTTGLTYRVNNYTPDLPRETTSQEIRKAFKTWSDVTPLRFTEVTSAGVKVDIDIGFYTRNHNDGSNFDGKGGVLAHAFFPQYGGDAHFDEDEQWTSRTPSGTNLLQVAIHEFGHSLGLGHSSVKEAIMAPFYRQYQPDVKLHSDDIAGIKYLYETMAVKKSPATGRPNFSTDLCRDPKPDAIFAVFDDIYIFKGSYYYVSGANGIHLGYPKMISDDWQDLPNDVDTAFFWPPDPEVRDNSTAAIYFFKGNKYWSYNMWRQQKSGPQSIASRFTGLPNDVDAAFLWSGNGRLYFIKGDQYFRSSEGQRIDDNYPQPLRFWKGLPSKIDTVFKYTNSRTYFFSGLNFYRFNDVNFKVDEGYPKSTSMWWFGCSSTDPNKSPSDFDMVNSEWMKGGDQFMPDGVRPLTASVCLLISAILTFLCALYLS